MQATEFLRRVGLFRTLTGHQIERFAGLAVAAHFPEGNIFREFDHPDGMYIVTSGKVKVTKSATDDSGAETVLAILREGTSFGEIGLIDGLPRSANATAIEPTTCYFLPRDGFIQAVHQNPDVAFIMLGTLATMVRSADNLANGLFPLPCAIRSFSL